MIYKDNNNNTHIITSDYIFINSLDDMDLISDNQITLQGYEILIKADDCSLTQMANEDITLISNYILLKSDNSNPTQRIQIWGDGDTLLIESKNGDIDIINESDPITISSGNNVCINASSDIELEASSDIIVKASDTIKINSSGGICLDDSGGNALKLISRDANESQIYIRCIYGNSGNEYIQSAIKLNKKDIHIIANKDTASSNTYGDIYIQTNNMQSPVTLKQYIQGVMNGTY